MIRPCRTMPDIPFFLVFVALLTGCADYQFTVNERVVYTPAPLFRDFNTPDAALEQCIRQHVADASITAADQLTELNCSHAGVASLQGLEVFAHLIRLKLSNNQISDLAPLAGLAALSELYLDGNQLRGVMALRGLGSLEVLDLAGNDALTCQQLDYFRRQPRLELSSPAHCQKASTAGAAN